MITQRQGLHTCCHTTTLWCVDLLLEVGCGSGEQDEQDEREVTQQRECGSQVRINTLGFIYSVNRN